MILFFLESTSGSLISQNVYTEIAEPCLQRAPETLALEGGRKDVLW